MAHRIDFTTAAVASAAATSNVWMDGAQMNIRAFMTDPFWSESLGFLGAMWLIIQISYWIYEKMKSRRSDEGHDDG